jgi:hypothetical protein
MTTTQRHPELDTTDDADRFRECEGWMRVAMRDQIGRGNLMAISGFRVVAGKYGIELPVAHGYHVQVLLQGNDMYTVRRLFARGFKVFVHGEAREVGCERLSEVARMASCFESYDAQEWPTKA